MIVIEDFVHLVGAYLRFLPALLFSSSAFSGAFSLVLASLDLPSPEIILAGLDTIEDVLKAPIKNPQLGQAVQMLSITHGARLTALTLHGLVQSYPEDGIEPIVEIMRELFKYSPGEMLGWVGKALESLPGHVMPVGDKQKLLLTYQE